MYKEELIKIKDDCITCNKAVIDAASVYFDQMIEAAIHSADNEAYHEMQKCNFLFKDMYTEIGGILYEMTPDHILSDQIAAIDSIIGKYMPRINYSYRVITHNHRICVDPSWEMHVIRMKDIAKGIDNRLLALLTIIERERNGYYGNN